MHPPSVKGTKYSLAEFSCKKTSNMEQQCTIKGWIYRGAKMHPRKVSSIGWFWRVDIWQCRICRFHFFHFRLGASCKTASIRPPSSIRLRCKFMHICIARLSPSPSGADLIQYMHPFSSGKKLWPKFSRIFLKCTWLAEKFAVCCGKLAVNRLWVIRSTDGWRHLHKVFISWSLRTFMMMASERLYIKIFNSRHNIE